MSEIVDQMHLKLTAMDVENIRLIMALYPYPRSKTAAIRAALADVVHNADPVQLEAARKTIRKNNKSVERVTA